MKAKTNYKKPLFFGWYSINSERKTSQHNRLKLDDFSMRDLDYLYKK
jgi:hypothetical protein